MVVAIASTITYFRSLNETGINWPAGLNDDISAKIGFALSAILAVVITCVIALAGVGSRRK
jgi:hypothetical protein